MPSSMETDRAVIIRYHKCVCFGSVIDWLSGGMKEDITAFFAVDAAFLHDIFYRNLAQRTLPQLPEEGLFNGFPGKIRHVRRPFP